MLIDDTHDRCRFIESNMMKIQNKRMKKNTIKTLNNSSFHPVCRWHLSMFCPGPHSLLAMLQAGASPNAVDKNWSETTSLATAGSHWESPNGGGTPSKELSFGKGGRVQNVWLASVKRKNLMGISSCPYSIHFSFYCHDWNTLQQPCLSSPTSPPSLSVTNLRALRQILCSLYSQ